MMCWYYTMNKMQMKLIITVFLTAVGTMYSAEASGPTDSWIARGQTVLEGLSTRVCEESRRTPDFDLKDADYGKLLAHQTIDAACDTDSLSLASERAVPGVHEKLGGLADGDLLGRLRLMDGYGIAVDLVAYASSGLAVGRILCYPDDGQPHSTVLHLHGGFGGIFQNPDGNMLETCVNWALLHHRTAFAPSYRGQDGGEGTMELCLGEADDVAAGATMLRSLEVTDPDRMGIVGGSTGGCVALRAGAKIPNLRAVVSYVPPADWKSLVEYHRNSFIPATERNCDGSTVAWDVGGTNMADVIDNAICGHPLYSNADYEARSTIPGVFNQTAPTLIISAESDNIVPLEQQLLYSILRQQLGNPVDIYVVDRCAAPSAPGVAFDAHVMVRDAFHALSPATISSGLIFLMDALDQ